MDHNQETLKYMEKIWKKLVIEHGSFMRKKKIPYISLKTSFFIQSFVTKRGKSTPPERFIRITFNEKTQRYEYALIKGENDDNVVKTVLYLLSRWTEYLQYINTLNKQRKKFTINTKEASYYPTYVASKVKVSKQFIQYLKSNGKDVTGYSYFTFRIRQAIFDESNYSSKISSILADMYMVIYLIAIRLKKMLKMLEYFHQQGTPSEYCNYLSKQKIPKSLDKNRWLSFIDKVFNGGISFSEDVRVTDLNNPHLNETTIFITVRDPKDSLNEIYRFPIVLFNVFRQITQFLVTPREPSINYYNDFFQTLSWLFENGISEKIVPKEFINVDVYHFNSLHYLPREYTSLSLSKDQKYYSEDGYPSLKDVILDGKNITRQSPPLYKQKDNRMNFLALSNSKITEIRAIIEKTNEPISLPLVPFLDKWINGEVIENKCELYELSRNIKDSFA